MALALRFFTCLVLTVCIVASVNADISCIPVSTTMAPCLFYLQYGGQVPPDCCAGIIVLKSIAKTTYDRQQVCRCLQYGTRFLPIDKTIAAGLPGKCGVTIPNPIALSTDCNKIK